MTALHHAVSEGHGDAVILLLKSGAEADKRDGEGRLAIDLVPDAKVRLILFAVESAHLTSNSSAPQVKQYILQTAEREGIELP